MLSRHGIRMPPGLVPKELAELRSLKGLYLQKNLLTGTTTAAAAADVCSYHAIHLLTVSLLRLVFVAMVRNSTLALTH
jgi:hypothetical protein